MTIDFPTLHLFLWAVNLAFLPYWIYKRQENFIYAAVLLFFLLALPVMAAINQPNQQLTIY